MSTQARSDAPLVSIILCTYNRASLVTRAIRSVMEQTYSSWELIIIDDGSRDGTEEILLPLARIDPRLVYHRHSNKGLAASRNVGIAIAKGAYVTFIDSDDEYLPWHLEKRMQYMRRHANVDVVHGGLRCTGPRKKHYVPDATRPGRKIHISRCFVAGTMVAKRNVLKRMGGFSDLAFADDFEIFQRLKKRFVVRKIDYPTYAYHCEADDRLCDLYEKGGTEAILRFRQ